MIVRVEAESRPGLCYSKPEQASNVTAETIRSTFMTQLEDNEDCSLALSAMLYQSHITWRIGEVIEIRTCAKHRKWVTVTSQLRQAHLADLESVRNGRTRLIGEDMYGYRYKRGERNSRFVACRTALLSEGQVLCCSCLWDELWKNVENVLMDKKTQAAIKSVISTRSWYRDVQTILQSTLLYTIFVVTLGLTVLALGKSSTEVAIAIVAAGLSASYTVLVLITEESDTTVQQALTFSGSNECVGSHINMALGNNGKPIYDKGTERLSPGTYLVQDPDLLKNITMFCSAALCTRKMREVLRREQSCAVGANLGSKTLWDIVMTSERIRLLGCLLTNKFYVVHTSSGLKAFAVNNASPTTRHTDWKEVTEEVAGVVEDNHVVLG